MLLQSLFCRNSQNLFLLKCIINLQNKKMKQRNFGRATPISYGNKRRNQYKLNKIPILNQALPAVGIISYSSYGTLVIDPQQWRSVHRWLWKSTRKIISKQREPMLQSVLPDHVHGINNMFFSSLKCLCPPALTTALTRMHFCLLLTLEAMEIQMQMSAPPLPISVILSNHLSFICASDELSRDLEIV